MKKSKKAVNQRQTFRLPLSAIYLVVIKEGGKNPIPAAVLEISQSGAKLMTQAPLSGRKELEVLLNSEKNLYSLPIRVIWEKKRLLNFFSGVEFSSKKLDSILRQMFLSFEEKNRSLTVLKDFLNSMERCQSG